MTEAKTALQILKDARALLARPYGWMKGSFIGTNQRGAVCYCALGALQAAARMAPERAVFDGNYTAAKDALTKAINWYYIPDWNDNKNTKKSDVLAAFDKAIAVMEEV